MEPFALAIDLGERKSPFRASDFRKNLVEPLSEARTKLADFFSRLLVDPRLCAFREQGGLRATLSSSFRDRALREHRSTSSLPLHAFPKLACFSSLGMARVPDPALNEHILIVRVP